MDMTGPGFAPDDLDLAAGVGSRPRVAVDTGLDLAALTGELGGEIAAPLTAALERINTLAATGRIDRSSLTALRLEVEGARRAAMIAQQLARLASGRVRQAPEPLNLTQHLRDALAQRSREFVARQIDLRQSLQPAQVVVDGTYLFSLVQALLDWSIGHSHRRLDIKLDVQPWPLQARLTCRLAHQSPDADALPPMDTMAWRLIEVAARSMGLELHRDDTANETRVTLAFPRTVNEQMEGVTAIELDEGFAQSINSKPLAGSHVLVLASRRELRAMIRDAIRPMGLMVDYTSTVDEAREFCQGGLPHAIVFESSIGGGRFDTLRRELLAEVPSLAFIAIGEDGHDYSTKDIDGHPVTRVGREAVMNALPAALIFELSRGLEV
jgi:hypothetical protein